MFRLLRLTLALIVTFAAVIFVARLIGRTQPSPVAVLFSNPDGTSCERPCLFGIQPGKMTLDEAVAALKSHPLTTELKFSSSDGWAEGEGRGILSNKRMVVVFGVVEEGNTQQVWRVELFNDKDQGSNVSPAIATFGDFRAFLGQEENWEIYDKDYQYACFPNWIEIVVNVPSETKRTRNLDASVISLTAG